MSRLFLGTTACEFDRLIVHNKKVNQLNTSSLVSNREGKREKKKIEREREKEREKERTE